MAAKAWFYQAWNAFGGRPVAPAFRKFYQHGFQPQMTRREEKLPLFLESGCFHA
ncbi:hypothetical protein HanPI659440_Chr14g0545661 [Helianthus annuus]|nr:hypothetical protein HanPI659440_Chr14g0545661 [Helianthus annuus]